METSLPLFTLNEGYTPRHFVGVNYVTQYLVVPMLLNIENTGQVSIYAFGESLFKPENPALIIKGFNIQKFLKRRCS